LLGHYLTGPLLGVRQKLVVLDQRQSEPELFWGYLVLASALGLILTPLGFPFRFGLLVTLGPILIYIVSPVDNVVIEYRAYLSAFGVALVLAPLGWGIVPLAVAWMVLGRRRIGVYGSTSRFWLQAKTDCPIPALLLRHLEAVHQVDDECQTLIGIAMVRFDASKYPTVDELEEARFILDEVTTKYPDQARGWVELAAIEYQLSHFKKAVDAYRMALVVAPESARAHAGLAEALARSGALDPAVTHFRRAWELEPGNEAHRLHFLEALEKANRWLELGMHTAILDKERMLYVSPDMLPKEITHG